MAEVPSPESAVRELVNAWRDNREWQSVAQTDAENLINRITTFVTEQCNARLEEAAKVADAGFEEWGKLSTEYWDEGDHDNAKIRMGWSNGASAIAQRIRSLMEDSNAQ